MRVNAALTPRFQPHNYFNWFETVSTIFIAFGRCEISVTIHGDTQNDMGFAAG